MGTLKDKRYVEIDFDPPESWNTAIGSGGVVVYTSTAAGSTVTVDKVDGNEQEHAAIPVGAKITTTGGTAVIEIP